jgi:hypothetical protein
LQTVAAMIGKTEARRPKEPVMAIPQRISLSLHVSSCLAVAVQGLGIKLVLAAACMLSGADAASEPQLGFHTGGPPLTASLMSVASSLFEIVVVVALAHFPDLFPLSYDPICLDAPRQGLRSSW